MRITCPNCAAEYDVDDSLIPDQGRDVQCSNCGKGWFQSKHAEADREDPIAESVASEDHEPEDTSFETEEAVEYEIEADKPPDLVAETEEEEIERGELRYAGQESSVEAAGPDEDRPRLEDEPSADEATDVSDEPEPPPVVEDEPQSEETYREDAEEDDTAPRREFAQHQRTADEAALGILREEAERELAARREESPPIESQPDLGLGEPAQAREGGRDHLARLRGEVSAASTGAVAAGARRDMFPDIDEINSTLRSSVDREHGDQGADAEEQVIRNRRRGFRVGFALALLIAAALILIYVYAPAIAARVPALETFLVGYVDWANRSIEWLDGVLESLLNATN